MKNNKGLTLIEVIFAMVILSVLLVTFITAFGQGAIIMSKGKDFTNDTFSYQEIMENNVVDGKKDFIAGNCEKDGTIEIFNGDYRSNVDIKEIKTDIRGNRKYIAYVTNYEIKEPEPPRINPFEVVVCDKNGNIVFPWYKDDIRIRARYTLLSSPLIFENRIRWYRSKEEILNPVFASDYEVIFEETHKEPAANSYTKELASNNSDFKSKHFYYFEARPYTFAGRIDHFRNEDRILILDRNGSLQWQNYMEAIYFKKNNDAVKIFNIDSKEVYLDIMQNPNWPTLNLDWAENEDPQGALVGMQIPSEHIGNDFQTEIKFKIDGHALLNADTILGIGIGLVDDKNSGFMMDFDAINNLINVCLIDNGKYTNYNSLLKSIDIMHDEEFKSFRDKNGGFFDWSNDYVLTIQFLNNDKKILLMLEDDETSSNFIEIDIRNLEITPKYIGLKSFSNIDYKPDMKYEIVSKFDRNYSSHFYDVDFENLSYVIDD